jgi:hypothetical protein
LRKILTFFRDNLVLTAIAVIAPIVVWFFWQREIYNIEICVSPPVGIYPVDKGLDSVLSLNFRGTKLDDLSSVDITVRNTGNQVIARQDFDLPLKFEFLCQGMLRPTIVSTNRNSLRNAIQLETAQIDSFYLQVAEQVSSDSLTRERIQEKIDENKLYEAAFLGLSLLNRPTRTPELFSFSLKPFLLNPADEIRLRAYAIGLKKIEGEYSRIVCRIVNVTNPYIIYEAQEVSEGMSLTQWIKAIGVASFIVSIIALLFQWLITSRISVGIMQKRINELKTDSVVSRAELTANILEIEDYDRKGTLLIIRVKIESLLRELFGLKKIPLTGRARQPGSILTLTRVLENEGVISNKLANAIIDAMPALNREAHSSDTYLDNEEYNSLYNLGLEIIVSLANVTLEISSAKI